MPLCSGLLLSDTRNELLTHVATRVNLRNMPSGRSRALKSTYCTIPFILNSRTGNAKLQRQRADEELPVAEDGAGTDCKVAQIKKELLRVTESFYFLKMVVVTRETRVHE